jgi:hypothetical protein
MTTEVTLCPDMALTCHCSGKSRLHAPAQPAKRCSATPDAVSFFTMSKSTRRESAPCTHICEGQQLVLARCRNVRLFGVSCVLCTSPWQRFIRRKTEARARLINSVTVFERLRIVAAATLLSLTLLSRSTLLSPYSLTQHFRQPRQPGTIVAATSFPRDNS